MKYTDEERQKALDWLKVKIKPRLPFAGGNYRMTKEELDSITIDLEDKTNKARINYLLQMVWQNWVSGNDWITDWSYRLLDPLDKGIIAMDDDCDCTDLEDGDPSYFDIYCKLFNDSDAIRNATAFVENMEHSDVLETIAKLKHQVVYYKWRYEPDTLTEAEKFAVSYCGFKRRTDEEAKKWLTDECIYDFPGTEQDEDDKDEGYPYQDIVSRLADEDGLTYDKIKDTFNKLAVRMGIDGGDAIEAMSRLKAMWALKTNKVDITGIKQCGQGVDHDFELDGLRYEIKTRRGEYNKDFFYNGKGAGCEFKKVDTADRFITVASDGWAGCWDIKSHYEVGYPSHQFKNDYDKKYEVRTPMAYYRIADAIWETQIPEPDWEAWKKIDDVWEDQKPK